MSPRRNKIAVLQQAILSELKSMPCTVAAVVQQKPLSALVDEAVHAQNQHRSFMPPAGLAARPEQALTTARLAAAWSPRMKTSRPAGRITQRPARRQP